VFLVVSFLTPVIFISSSIVFATPTNKDLPSNLFVDKIASATLKKALLSHHKLASMATQLLKRCGLLIRAFITLNPPNE
jgi:hypothetical protein